MFVKKKKDYQVVYGVSFACLKFLGHDVCEFLSPFLIVFSYIMSVHQFCCLGVGFFIVFVFLNKLCLIQ